YVVSARYPSLCFFFSPSPAATLIYPLPHTTLFRSADFFIYDIRLRPDNIKSPGIPIHDSIGGYKYSPSDDIRYLLTPFRTVVEQLPQQSAKPLIVESDWLFSMLSRHPQFKRSLHSLTTDTSLAFPVPEESLPVQHSSPLPAIILLLVWGI